MHTATNQSSSLASALLCVQQALQPAAKDGKNPYHATRYATLNSIMASCRELLISHGILLTQMPVVQPVELGQNVLALETRLTHVDTGEYLASTAIVPLPKADPQGLGSAITYARRYALCAILGIITEDDDGTFSPGIFAKARWGQLQHGHQLRGPNICCRCRRNNGKESPSPEGGLPMGQQAAVLVEIRGH